MKIDSVRTIGRARIIKERVGEKGKEERETAKWERKGKLVLRLW